MLRKILLALLAAAPAVAQFMPMLQDAIVTPAPEGSGDLHRTKPVQVAIIATGINPVASVRYSLNGGPGVEGRRRPPGQMVKVTLDIDREGTNELRYWAFNTDGRISMGDPVRTPADGFGIRQAVTLAAPTAAGASAITLSAGEGRTSGEQLYIGVEGNWELITLAKISGPLATLKSKLEFAHDALEPVHLTWRTVTIRIDTRRR
jgi:hypothetical protein